MLRSSLRQCYIKEIKLDIGKEKKKLNGMKKLSLMKLKRKNIKKE